MTPTKPAQVFEFSCEIFPVHIPQLGMTEMLLHIDCVEAHGLALEELRGQSVKVTIEAVEGDGE